MLIRTHSGLVYNQLHKFKLIQDPEAESIAYEALYNAIVKYDASKGAKLSTVATVYIYNALGSYIRSLKSKRKIDTISYNNVIYRDDKGDHELVEVLPSDKNIERDYIHSEVCLHAMSVFDELLAELTNDKHKLILTEWKKSEFSAQTKDIAPTVGVSQSYVSQVINNFKFKLKKKLEDIYYD